MDYVVGSVAALISGDANVTPTRPRPKKRALTPKKHQPSPNVTPKSEMVEDRSIFLSPSLQRKKAIVKKSPKRIFENPDLDLTNDGEGTSVTSPKADKVKKHLKDDLEDSANSSLKSSKSPKGKPMPFKSESPKKLKIDFEEETLNVNVQVSNENTPTKKNKRRSIIEASGTFEIEEKENLRSEDFVPVVNIGNDARQSPKTNRKSVSKSTGNIEVEEILNNQEIKPHSTANKKSKSLSSGLGSLKKESPNEQNQTVEKQEDKQKSKKKNKRKKKSKLQNLINTEMEEPSVNQESEQTDKSETKSPKKKKNITNKDSNSTEYNGESESPKKKKKKHIVNPNAITHKDSDSEHESDDEIESETEQVNNEILDTGPLEESSDDEKEDKKLEKKEHTERHSEEEIKRTLFVGNVPFSSKTKKEIKKIFRKYGAIETIRVRSVPMKDARFTPKLAVIKNELHPERTTVNVYVKFSETSSVDQALVENNTVLNSHHLSVSRSHESGAEHDPRCAVFVGNLPFALEDETFRALFEKCGQIHSVRIVRDKKTKAGKGFGYINFASKDGVELALAMTEDDLMVKNKILRVKRCTQNPRKQSKSTDSSTQGYQGRNRGGFQGRNQDENQFQGRNQGDVRGRGRGDFRGRTRGGFQGRNQGNVQGRGQGSFRGNHGGFQGSNRGGFQGSNRGGFQGSNRGGFQGRNRGGFQGRNRDSFQGRGGFGRQDDEGKVNGAERRLMNKRKSQESGDGEGPPNKRANSDQPVIREKKERKEFVGMTAEKKKKHKIDKGQKKKKALSEILTK